ncbi:uncharacterized protein BX664DRAFT_203368 [Halteromyces radiatus]|uniref:uncharacterized protein n=1 Tax=Halteromyces radiatus TaxID=101107 RepID=UPI00221EE6A4|nr:uncharacterized protein BX664DRAFT_203368 [Halteromyces radiatus]KAI8079836.1 hypothetical protein BX664DRAFT_203368 [Halteromyces radiatus]
MKLLPCVLFLLLDHVILSLADAVAPRAFISCSLVLEKVYCFGGNTGQYQGSNFLNPTNDFFSLDMSSFDFNGNLTTAQSNWTIITGTTGSSLVEARGAALTSSIANHGKFIVYGGGASNFLYNPLIEFDPPSNTWTSIQDYGQYTAIGGIVNNDNTQDLWTWGGNINDTSYHADNVVYNYNYGANQWTAIPGDTVNKNVRYAYTATMGSDHVIYIIGGFENTPLTNSDNGQGVDMHQVRWFNTNTSAWGTDTATSNQNVSARAYHTATLIPGSTKILVYGGSVFVGQVNTIPDDYAYSYDYAAKQYTLLNLTGGAGKRSAHAAVSYKNYIFIMFGFDQNLQLHRDVNIMDVSNASQPVWHSPPPTNSSSGDIPSDGNSNNNVDSQGLSTNAIAGIAVAAVVVGLGAIAGGLFFMYRKKKQKRQFELEKLDPRSHIPIYDLPDHTTDTPIYTNNISSVPSPFLDNKKAIDDHTRLPENFHQGITETIKPTVYQSTDYSKPHGDE